MTDKPLDPEFGASLAAACRSQETIALLSRRRSTAADALCGPGPDADQLRQILTIAARVPDHRRVTPYRFILFEGEARARFGAHLRRVFLQNEPEATDARADKEAARFQRAPTVVAVISKVDPNHRTPKWEQILTVGAVCQNMLIAASAHGFAAQWLTEWYAFDDEVNAVLSLAEHERVAGYIYLGSAKDDPKERARPDVPALITRY